MAGEIWIDPVQERVVRLAGSLQQDKDFGWGILGELDKGGWVEIDQADVGNHQWRIVHLKLVMNGRVLFKAKNSNSVQEYTQFVPLPPDLTYRQAIEILRSLPASPIQASRWWTRSPKTERPRPDGRGRFAVSKPALLHLREDNAQGE